MPYRHAPYYVLFCAVVVIAGFWPSYFGVFGSVPWQFHAHGVGASLWVLMVLAQSWTPHHGQLALHRAVGMASLLLFPFLIGGLFAIIDLTAKGFVAGISPVRTLLGGEFLIGLLLAVAAYLVLFYRALKYRRKVWVHSGYMLATPLILFESPFSRWMEQLVPAWFQVTPADFGQIIVNIEWAMAVELAFIAALWWRYRDRAKPFLVAGLFIVAQMLTMGLMSRNPVLEATLTVLGGTPAWITVAAGMGLGAVTAWAGWEAGKRRPAPAKGMAAA